MASPMSSPSTKVSTPCQGYAGCLRRAEGAPTRCATSTAADFAGSGVADHRDRQVRVGDRRRAAGVVDDVEDPALAVAGIEEDRQHVLEAPGGEGRRDLERVRRENVDPLV